MTSNSASSLAPICLFVYKRLDTLKQLIRSLQKNELAPLSELFIFSDAAATQSDEQAVQEVRDFCNDITGFKSVTLHFSPHNKGLANSIINGVTIVINEYDKVIVLEDDLVVSNNFLSFMNEALHFYQHHPKMFSVAGYSSPIKTTNACDVYFTKRGSSWGWGTWKHTWHTIDWTVADYHFFVQNKELQNGFNKMGSDLTGSLAKQMQGKINSWAIRWVYAQYKNDLYTVYPVHSKVLNEGFGGKATHTSFVNRSRFSTQLDMSNKNTFCFPKNPELNPGILNQFTDRYSIKTRLLYKIKGYFN